MRKFQELKSRAQQYLLPRTLEDYISQDDIVQRITAQTETTEDGKN